MKALKTIIQNFKRALRFMRDLLLCDVSADVAWSVWLASMRALRAFMQKGYYTKSIAIVTILCFELSTLWTSGYSIGYEDLRRQQLQQQQRTGSQ